MVKRYFDDERLHRIFSFQAMYAGLAPYEALAIYAVITYMDTVNGVFVPEGGVHALPRALAAAAEQAGVVFRYGARGRSDPARLRHERRRARRPPRRRRGHHDRHRRVQSRPAGRLPHAAARTAHAAGGPPRALLAVGGRLARRRQRAPCPPAPPTTTSTSAASGTSRSVRSSTTARRMADPSLLITVPTIDEPSMAPDGRHVLFVLEPVPNLDGSVDWTTERPRARAVDRARWQRLGYPTDVEVEHFVDPLDWESQGMERGTPFGLAHLFFQTGPFRPANVEAKAPGLVFVGSSTVPGVGVPMVLISGQLAAERVEQFRTAEMTDRPVTLDESYARCRVLNRRYGTTYYWSTFALPRIKRHHVWALYAFCRYADDIVDDLGPASVATRRDALLAVRRPVLRRPVRRSVRTTRC